MRIVSRNELTYLIFRNVENMKTIAFNSEDQVLNTAIEKSTFLIAFKTILLSKKILTDMATLYILKSLDKAKGDC